MVALAILVLARLIAQEPEPPLALSNAAGEPLRNARIVRFDGLKFEVEHDGGVASIPWGRMPEEIRRRFPFDPNRALTPRPDGPILPPAVLPTPSAVTPSPTAAPSPTPAARAERLVFRRELRKGDLYILSTIGGPAGDLKITNVTQTEVSFSRYRFGSETRELQLGFGEPRTLLFSDGRGCDVYFVNVRNPPRYFAVVEFDYAPDAASRPR